MLTPEALNRAGLGKDKLNDLSEISKAAATIGSKVLMSHYGHITKVRNKGTIGDLVTEADIESETKIISFLNEKTQDISILAEESGLTGSYNSLYWCIDPLDGTTNFAHSYPLFATSVGLIWKNIPILGAIAVPYLNELYWGCPHIGAFCNDMPINVSKATNLEDSLLVTGFAYDRLTTKNNNYAEFCWMTHKTRGVRRGGAAAVDLAFVASGRLDGYWERGLAKWDLAAGVPIVELAGGLVSDYPTGNFDLTNGRILASTASISNDLKNELGKVIPLEEQFYCVPHPRTQYSN